MVVPRTTGSQEHVPEYEMTAIQQEYERLTPVSAQMMERAARSMPRGLTRTLSWFAPYPGRVRTRRRRDALRTSTATATSTCSATA